MNRNLSSLAGIAFAAAIFFPVTVRAVVIDFVLVGDPGNSNDSTTGYGAVATAYQIGKYEVTNSQYAEFLNAVAKTDTYELYNPSMGSDARGGITQSGVPGSYTYEVKANMGDKPVNYVSWYDSARFTNWLNNSQPTGLQTTLTTEGGAYTLTGSNGVISKNGSATVWIPTENEWYKAAYHDPTAGGTGNYWLYPTQSDSLPTVALADLLGNVSNPGPNVANTTNGADWNGMDGNVTTVGSTGSDSYYGTFDQGGNVSEWNDAINGSARGIRGGSYELFGIYSVPATASAPLNPFIEGALLGFRVASVPEPGVAALTVLASGLILRRRRR